MNNHFSYSEARSNFKTLFDAVEEGNVAVVERRGSRPLALIDRAEADSLLSEKFPFEPEVSFAKAMGGKGKSATSAVAMWLPNLPVHSDGADFQEAAENLVEALIDYAELWEAELRHAPNHAGNLGWVRRVQLFSPNRQDVRKLLFSE